MILMRITIERVFMITWNTPAQWDNCGYERDKNGNIIYFDTEKQAQDYIEELEKKTEGSGIWYGIRHKDIEI
jgi:N-acetylmuramoyl-L-alanine amidase CwlA